MGLASLSNEDELWDFDGSLMESSSDIDREWLRRQKEFQTIGYREGLMTGKEVSAQLGFNFGFKESVTAGYNWGLVRGVTSAMANLPDQLKGRLVQTVEKKKDIHLLHEAVQSISTADALKLFHASLMCKPLEEGQCAENSSCKPNLVSQSLGENALENYQKQLQSLIVDPPAMQVHFETLR